MYKSDQERIVIVVLAAHIALWSSHQFSKIIILKSPLQKDLLVILLFYLYRNISSLLVNQLHCHSHKCQTPAISSITHVQTIMHMHTITDAAYKSPGASVSFSIIYLNIVVLLTGIRARCHGPGQTPWVLLDTPWCSALDLFKGLPIPHVLCFKDAAC